jgi:hypothetical protein
MKDFHAKDLLKADRHRPMLKALARCAGEQKKIYPATWAIVVDDFNSFSLQQRKFFTGAMLDPASGELVTSGCPSKPYFAPFQSIVRLITDATPVSGKANFTFGLDKQSHGYLVDMFSRITKDAAVDKPYSIWKSKERLGNALFPLAAETPQLQAADLLVHLEYRMLDDWRTAGKKGQSPAHIYELMGLCLSNMRNKGDHIYQDKALLQQAINQAKRFAPRWKDQ